MQMPDTARRFTAHRALSTVARTAVVVAAISLLLAFISKPVYRANVKVLLESGGSQDLTPGNVLAPMLYNVAAHSIPTQIEVLKSKKVLHDAYRDADVPIGTVTVQAHQIGSTDVVEIIVEGSTPTYVERVAKTLPNTYIGYAGGNHSTELRNAYNFATTRLKEENDHLVQYDVDLEKLRKSEMSAIGVEELNHNRKLQSDTVDQLWKSAEELRLRMTIQHDPVMVIEPAEAAELVSPSASKKILFCCLLGLGFGVVAAGIRGLIAVKSRRV